MNLKAVWTDLAIDDPKEISDYLDESNPSAAERIGRGIIEHVKILESFPMIGPAYPRRSSGTIREIVCGNYRIFYEVVKEAKAVNLLRIWHGARNEPPRLR